MGVGIALVAAQVGKLQVCLVDSKAEPLKRGTKFMGAFIVKKIIYTFFVTYSGNRRSLEKRRFERETHGSRGKGSPFAHYNEHRDGETL